MKLTTGVQIDQKLRPPGMGSYFPVAMRAMSSNAVWSRTERANDLQGLQICRELCRDLN